MATYETKPDPMGNGTPKPSVADAVRHLGDEASKIGDDASRRMSSMTEAARKSGMAALDQLQGQVRERPAMTLGIAAGAGIIVGLLIAGRR